MYLITFRFTTESWNDAGTVYCQLVCSNSKLQTPLTLLDAGIHCLTIPIHIGQGQIYEAKDKKKESDGHLHQY